MRLERDRQSGRVDVGWQQPGRHLNPLPRTETRKEKGFAASGRIRQVDISDQEARLCPRRQKSSDPGRLTVGEPTFREPIRNQRWLNGF
jgi:hypothetical protein